MKARGSITVFLSLVLMVMITVLFTVIEAARINGRRFMAECSSDMALQSVLAEYNTPMLEQFDLFFIDTGYGYDDNAGRLTEHIVEYLNQNLQREEAETLLSFGKYRDLYNLSPGNIEITRQCHAVDMEGEVIERQAVDYMLDRYGLQDLAELKDNYKEANDNGLLSDSLEKKRKENEQDIRNVNTKRKKKRYPINNPADKVNKLRGSRGILSMVVGNKEISNAFISPENYLSGRSYTEGDGFLQGEKRISLTEDLLFQKYLMEKCGNYRNQKENSKLKYEMEYILTGKNSDLANLKSVVERLLAIRESANFIYIMSNKEMQLEAGAMASALSVVLLFPQLQPFIKLSLLIAWSFSESVNDVKILLDGGKVPLFKTEETWHLSLKNALKMKQKNTDQSKNQKGMDYESYLHILLLMESKEKRNIRFMDIVEMDVRQNKGYENFRLDHCVHDFEVNIQIDSIAGQSMELKRLVGYQK